MLASKFCKRISTRLQIRNFCLELLKMACYCDNSSTTSYTHEELSHIKNAISIFPPLTNNTFRKGDYGRIGVIGGSVEYTGAPYFAAYTPLQIGGDLSYVFCHENASAVIKSYSPELIVFPTMKFEEMHKTLQRVHSLVFGPGCGRDLENLLPLFKEVLMFVNNNPEICLVVDADGLFIAGECVEELRSCKGQIILTPNHREFEHLYSKIFSTNKIEEEKNLMMVDNNSEQVKQLAENLKLCIVKKQSVDIISDGKTVNKCHIKGTPRRCGGQGDILTGSIALFIHWARLKNADHEHNKMFYSTQHLIQGALAACEFVRFTSRKTFERIGRSMKANDVILEIPNVVRQIDKEFGDKKF